MIHYFCPAASIVLVMFLPLCDGIAWYTPQRCVHISHRNCRHGGPQDAMAKSPLCTSSCNLQQYKPQQHSPHFPSLNQSLSPFEIIPSLLQQSGPHRLHEHGSCIPNPLSWSQQYPPQSPSDAQQEMCNYRQGGGQLQPQRPTWTGQYCVDVRNWRMLSLWSLLEHSQLRSCIGKGP